MMEFLVICVKWFENITNTAIYFTIVSDNVDLHMKIFNTVEEQFICLFTHLLWKRDRDLGA